MKITKRQLRNLIQRNLNEATAEEISHLDEALKIPKKFLPFQNMFGDKYRKVIPLYPNTPDSNNFNGLSGILLLTRHPVDVYRMSDFESIASCHSPPSKKGRSNSLYDSTNKCILSEVYAFGIVAYFYEIGDKDEIEEKMLKISSNDDEEIFSDPDRAIVTGLPDPSLRARVKNVSYHSKSNSTSLYKKFTKFDPVKHKDEYKFEGEESEAPVTFLPVLETQKIYGSSRKRKAEFKDISGYIQFILKPYQVQAMEKITANVIKDNVDNKTIDLTNFYKIGGTYQDSPVDEEIKNIITTYNKDNNSSFVTNGSVNLTSEFQDDVIKQMTKQQTKSDGEKEKVNFKNYVETLPEKTKTSNINSDIIYREGNMTFEVVESGTNEFYLILPSNPEPFYMNLNYSSNKFIINFESDIFTKDIAKKIYGTQIYDFTYIEDFVQNLNKKIKENSVFQSSILNLIPNADLSRFDPIYHAYFEYDKSEPVENFNMRLALYYGGINNLTKGQISDWIYVFKRVFETLIKIKNDIKDYIALELAKLDVIKVNEMKYQTEFEKQQAEAQKKFETSEDYKANKSPDYKKREFVGKKFDDSAFRELDIYKKYSFIYKDLIRNINQNFIEGKLAYAYMKQFDCTIEVVYGKEIEVIGDIIKRFKNIKGFKIKFKINFDNSIATLLDYFKDKDSEQHNDALKLLRFRKNLCNEENLPAGFTFPRKFCNYCIHNSNVNIQNYQLDNEINFDLENFLAQINVNDYIAGIKSQNYDFMMENSFKILFQKIFEYIVAHHNFLKLRSKSDFITPPFQADDNINNPYYTQPPRQTPPPPPPFPEEPPPFPEEPPPFPEEPPPFPDDELVPLDENRINELIMRRVITNLVYKRIKNKFV